MKKITKGPKKPIVIIWSVSTDSFEEQCEDYISAGYLIHNLGYVEDPSSWYGIFILPTAKFTENQK